MASKNSSGKTASKRTAQKNASTTKGKRTAKYENSIIGSKVKDEIWAIVIMAIGAFLIVSIQTDAAGSLGIILHNFFLGCFGHLAFILPYYLLIYGILLFINKVSHISSRSVTFMLLIFLMLALLNSVRYIDVSGFDWSIKSLNEIYAGGIALQNGGWFGMIMGTMIATVIGKPGLIIFSLVVIAISLLLVLNTPLSQFMDKMRIRREEKQEAAYAAELSEEKAIKEEPAPLNKKASKATSAVPNSEVKINKPSVDCSLTDDILETAYVPGRINEGQKNILAYMKDDNLFQDSNDTPIQGYDVERSGDHFDEEMSSEPGQAGDQIGLNETQSMTNQKPALTNKEAAAAALSQDELNLSSQMKFPYQLPPVDLLAKNKSGKQETDGNLKAKAAKLEHTLQNFNVDARVVQVTQGPAVTRYEIQPNIGVKVSSIVRLADDIALNMEAKSIRIEAPIPGKAAVGIEIENEQINMVALREIIASKEFDKAKSRISFAVGRDITGSAVVGDLKEMPHLLIAGSTGSGKSVCINSIIMSILYKATPSEVKFVLIDPKVVELRNYSGIPHLLIPVVTEPSKAAAALNWAVAEMTDRYRKFAEEGVRDLNSFNDSVRKKREDDRFMPQIVIVIDELADLMMAAPSQVEESICRLAQMARAAGMHLIVATQRPSVDVVTGVIKANIPSRIAFAVSSQVDSRTILDMAGAEKLVGKGDMLYNPLGMGKPLRVQGTFVSDSEVHKVIDFVKAQSDEPEYSGDIINSIENANKAASENDDTDELLQDAIETVVHSGQASASMLQRRFRIGYNRAARIIDMMEARGIIGPADGSRPRQVHMTETELYALQSETEDINNK
ncbi:MAG: DNA translocase FtsK [Eubacteriales bacterium]|nr:DNA translocase FtsK [Eubacteriales bacterium]MDD4390159.1 DNA translocase FtsK [Eubacteriales bacterium]